MVPRTIDDEMNPPLHPSLFSPEAPLTPLVAAFFGLPSFAGGGPGPASFRWASHVVAPRDDLARHARCSGYFEKLFLNRFVRITVVSAGCARLCRIVGFEAAKAEYTVPVGQGSVRVGTLLRVFDYCQAASLANSATGSLDTLDFSSCVYTLPISNVSSQPAKKPEAEALIAALGSLPGSSMEASRLASSPLTQLPAPAPTASFLKDLISESLRIMADQRAGLAAAVWSAPADGGSVAGWRLYGAEKGHGVHLILRSWLIQDALQEKLLNSATSSSSSSSSSFSAADVSGPVVGAKRRREDGGDNGDGVSDCEDAPAAAVSSGAGKRRRLDDSSSFVVAEGESAVFKRAIIGDDDSSGHDGRDGFHPDERLADGSKRVGYAARDERPLGKGGRGIGPDGRGWGPGRVPERVAGQYRFLLSQRGDADGNQGTLSLPFIAADLHADEYRPEVTAWRGVCEMLELKGALSLEAFSLCVLSQVDLASDINAGSAAASAVDTAPVSLPSGYPHPASIAEGAKLSVSATSNNHGGTAPADALLEAERLQSLAAGGSRRPLDRSLGFSAASMTNNVVPPVVAAAGAGAGNAEAPPEPVVPTCNGIRRYASPVQTFVVDLDAIAMAVAKQRLAARRREGQSDPSSSSSSSSSTSAAAPLESEVDESFAASGGGLNERAPPVPARLHVPDSTGGSNSNGVRGRATTPPSRIQPYAVAGALTDGSGSSGDSMALEAGWRVEAGRWLVKSVERSSSSLLQGSNRAWWLCEDEMLALTAASTVTSYSGASLAAPWPPAALATQVAALHAGAGAPASSQQSLPFFSTPPAQCFRESLADDAAANGLKKAWSRFLRSEMDSADGDKPAAATCVYPPLAAASSSMLLRLSGLQPWASASNAGPAAASSDSVSDLPRGTSYGFKPSLAADKAVEEAEEATRVKELAQLLEEEVTCSKRGVKMDATSVARLTALTATKPITEGLPPATVLYEALAAADALNGLSPIPYGPSGGRNKGATQVPAAAVISGHAGRAPWPLLSDLALPQAVSTTSLPWQPGPFGSVKHPHTAHSLIHPTFFSGFVPALLRRFGVAFPSVDDASALPVSPLCLAPSWLRAVFPLRNGAFLAGMFHGTAPTWGEAIAERGFHRAICRLLSPPNASTTCPVDALQATGSDVAHADHVLAHPERGFGAGQAAPFANLYSTLPHNCTCHFPGAGHQCNCNMMGFGVYLADRAHKADHFAVMRGQQRTQAAVENTVREAGGTVATASLTTGKASSSSSASAAAAAETVTTGTRLTCVVDVGHAKVGGSCPCVCGCGKAFVDHIGAFYCLQGYDSLYLRDGSLPATRNREWAVADPLRVDVVQVTYVMTL